MNQFDRLVEVVSRLRRECPWDKKQTHSSLIPYMREETDEAIEAIEKNDSQKLAEELGDQLLHILMHAEMSDEFSIEDIVNHIKNKMIRRHPHVFCSGLKTESLKKIWGRWDKIKEMENKMRQAGVRLQDLDENEIDKIWNKLIAEEEKKK